MKKEIKIFPELNEKTTTTQYTEIYGNNEGAL